MLIGAVAMVLLFIMMMPNNFFDWITYEFLSKAVAIFFIIPIAFAVLNLRAPKEIVVVVGIGSLLYVLYAYILVLTFRQGFEIILQTVVEIVFVTVAIEFSKNWMEKKLPP